MTTLVLGSTGYAGMMLLRLLGEHPDIDSIIAASSSAAGKLAIESDPGLSTQTVEKMHRTGGRFADPDDAVVEDIDVVISALPHRTAASMLAPYIGKLPVIDLSADFRFHNVKIYETTYGVTHPLPDLLDAAVYGMAEWHREEIRTAELIAVPGCYPAATLLPLLPFAKLITEPVVVNALSGVSGAGRKVNQDLLFNERSENANAYNPGRAHRHVPEIEQELLFFGSEAQILFTPHLVPLKQGMLTTIVAKLRQPLSQQEAEEIVRDVYRDDPCVGLSSRELPQTRDVRGTNRCDIAVRVHDDYLQLFSVLDNLVKGAAGQAIQCMNIRHGIPETAGLRLNGEF